MSSTLCCKRELWSAVHAAIATTLQLAYFKKDATTTIDFHSIITEAKEEACCAMCTTSVQYYSYEDLLVIATSLVRNVISRHKYFERWKVENIGDNWTSTIVDNISIMSLHN